MGQVLLIFEEGKKKMRNRKIATLLTFVLLVGTLVIGLTACGDKEDKAADGEKVLRVGLVQLVEHPSLDTIRESIIKELKAEGYEDGVNIKIDYQNAQNEMNNLKIICQAFVADKDDVIIAITTPAAQAAYSETQDIPIVFAAVTDPVAAELVKDVDAPGGNITGTSDRISASAIMELAFEITPDIKTVGAIYNSSEVNSQSVITDLKEYADSKNLKVVEAAVTNANEIQQAAQSLVGKVDAVFSPIDNTVASAMPVASAVFNDAKIPFYVSADSMVADGGLATCGVNYESLGAETGKMVAEILKGSKPATMPVKFVEDLTPYINSNTAAAIGVKIPQTVLDKAVDLGA
jgi:putative ABC transport system substrate-binding protein